MSNLFDDDAERVILAQLLSFKAVIPNIRGSVQANDFFNAANQRVFKAICSLLDEFGSVDPVSLETKLGKREGDHGFIAELMDTAATAANWKYYTTRVKRFSQVRAVRATAERLLRVSVDTVEKETSDAIGELTGIANTSGGQTIRSIKKVIPEVIGKIEEAYRNKGALIGIDTKIDGINDAFDGYPNDYTIIGARPSIGKTALAGTIIKNTASPTFPVGFVTIEMRDYKIVLRMISSSTGINSRSIRTGFLNAQNFMQIQDACSELYEKEIYFDDASTDLDHMKQTCRTMVRVHGVKAIFIDHASMITVQDESQHWEKMSLVSKTVKKLQRELNIPITLLCQLKTDAEGRKPTIADLRGSGSFSEDADTIMLLNRDRVETKGQPGIMIPAELDVVKARDGEIGVIPLVFFPQTSTFKDPPKK